MNEDILNTLRQQDTNLREALRQEEAERPQMPADLNARLMQRMSASCGSAAESAGKTVGNGRAHLWRWAAAAACLLIIIGIGVSKMFDHRSQPVAQSTTDSCKTLRGELTNSPRRIDKLSAENRTTLRGESSNSPRRVAKSATPNRSIGHAQSDNRPRPIEKPAVEDAPTEYAQSVNQAKPAEPAPEVLTERDIPITRPENYKYTPEEIALLKRQANEAYLKWVELELEIAKHSQEQTAQQY